MAAITYYVALPFVRAEDGSLVAGEAQDRQTASAAVKAAGTMHVGRRGGASAQRL